MKKIKLLFIVFLLNCTSFAQQQVSLIEANNAAVNILKTHPDKSHYSTSLINATFSINDDNKHTLLYEVLFNDGQVVLLSGNKACLPVLGYFNTPDHQSVLDTLNENIPEGLRDLIREYKEQIAWCFSHDTIALRYQNEWQNLQNANFLRVTRSIIVAPLITSRWNQNRSNDNQNCNAYSYFVPETSSICHCSSDGNNCPVGCVAVAMGQIMNYWKYPVYLSDKKNNQFNWCDMPDALYYLNNPNFERERNAIASLLKELGESDKLNMHYCWRGECSSSAYTGRARRTFVHSYGYNSDADYQLKSSYTNTVWKTRVKQNLDRLWPVFYQGSGTGIHAFICDGYDSDDKFHFNWGWGDGWDNYWLTLDDLTTNNNDFNSQQKAIFYIHPNTTQNYCNFSIPLWMHYYNYYTVEGNNSPFPWQNVPKTFNTLTSVDISIAQTLNAPTSWYTILTGQSSDYIAHEEIYLKPGFYAMAGSTFHAKIERCESCNDLQRSAVLDNHSEDMEDYFNLNDSMLSKKLFQTTNKLSQAEVETEEITLYPNPNNGSFTISTNFDPQEITSVQVYSSLGQIVYQQNGWKQENIQLPTSYKGVYIVKFTTKHNTFYQKMIVQ
jgi:hypothetical protein